MARVGSKPQPRKPAAPARRPVPGVPSRNQAQRADPVRFFRDIYSELRRTTWPTPEQTRNLTIIVIIVSTAIGLFLGVIDLIFSGVIRGILGF